MRTTNKIFQDFTDSGSGYATEVVYCASGGSLPKTIQEYHAVEELLVVFLDISTDTLLEVEMLDDDGSTWHLLLSTADTVGVYEPIRFFGLRGVRVRALSQGNAGTAKALIAWR